ncbi:complement inhibitor CirpT2-like [Amblyomma americanum]
MTLRRTTASSESYARRPKEDCAKALWLRRPRCAAETFLDRILGSGVLSASQHQDESRSGEMRSGICYVARSGTEIKNGHCTFRNKTIPVDQVINVEHPCEEWRCDAASKSVLIAGCSKMSAGRGCRMIDGRGQYPDCCPQMACSGDDS